MRKLKLESLSQQSKGLLVSWRQPSFSVNYLSLTRHNATFPCMALWQRPPPQPSPHPSNQIIHSSSSSFYLPLVKPWTQQTEGCPSRAVKWNWNLRCLFSRVFCELYLWYNQYLVTYTICHPVKLEYYPLFFGSWGWSRINGLCYL